MVSTPYTKGRSREYRVLRILREDGWLCSRSAASHGPVDVFAGRKGERRIIQVKSGKARISLKDREILKAWAQAYGARAEVWHFKKGGKVEKELIYDGRTPL